MIESHWLFQVPLEKIEVVVHPQQIIHSMVEFIDNSMLAQRASLTCWCLSNMPLLISKDMPAA